MYLHGISVACFSYTLLMNKYEIAGKDLLFFHFAPRRREPGCWWEKARNRIARTERERERDECEGTNEWREKKLKTIQSVYKNVYSVRPHAHKNGHCDKQSSLSTQYNVSTWQCCRPPFVRLLLSSSIQRRTFHHGRLGAMHPNRVFCIFLFFTIFCVLSSCWRLSCSFYHSLYYYPVNEIRSSRATWTRSELNAT